MKQQIKVGIIGTGFIGPTHIEAIRRLGYVEVVGLAENGLDSARKKAEQLNIPRAYGDYREMLADQDIDVVHNCTPNYLHFQINKDIIEAGKHVMSEKPLAMSKEESAQLLALAREHKVVHGVNFNYRQYPMVNQIAEMIRQHELGTIHLVHGSYLQDWLLYETDYNWRLASDVGGKSRAIADIGSHWCDTVQYVTGKRIVEVFADLWTVHATRKKSTGHQSTFGADVSADTMFENVKVDTEDYASVLFRFDDGSRGAFTVSQVSAGRKNALSFEVNGSQKSVYWQQEQPANLWIGHRDQPNECLIADPSLFLEEAKSSIHHPGGHGEGWPDALKNVMLKFYSYIRDGKNPLQDKADFATFEDGHLSMCIVEAILQSAEQQKWVKV